MNDPSATTQATSGVSRRAARLASIPSFRRVDAFLRKMTLMGLGEAGGDFTFGNPHQMPPDRYVNTLRDALAPQNDQWFAYQTNGESAREAAAASLERLLDVPFRPQDIYLTTGGFAAIALALKTVADPGDEIIFSLPPWFLYEPLILEAGLVPVKVKVETETFDLDLAAIDAAITERTRCVIVNSPNNPTGRIYPPVMLRRLADLLETASARIGRRIYLLSDEAYNRIVFDGTRFHSPAEFYPHTLLAYSYGKTHLSPGQRVGYLALPPTMPDADGLERAISGLQVAMGWVPGMAPAQPAAQPQAPAAPERAASPAPAYQAPQHVAAGVASSGLSNWGQQRPAALPADSGFDVDLPAVVEPDLSGGRSDDLDVPDFLK